MFPISVFYGKQTQALFIWDWTDFQRLTREEKDQSKDHLPDARVDCYRRMTGCICSGDRVSLLPLPHQTELYLHHLVREPQQQPSHTNKPALSLSSRCHLSAKCQHPAQSVLWPYCAQKCSGYMSWRCPQLSHIPHLTATYLALQTHGWILRFPQTPHVLLPSCSSTKSHLIAPEVQTALLGADTL